MASSKEIKHRTSHRADPPSLDHLAGVLQKCDIVLAPEQLELLWNYHQLLRHYNTDLNLTRIHNFTNMVLKLYADSILPGKLLDLPVPLMDLGTGAGMPGIPLKIAFPKLAILLAESRHNRVVFLERVCQRLHLEGVRIIGRSINESFTEPVNGVITRAVEAIADTLGRVRGCVAQDGLVIFMKGPRCDAEIAAASGRFEKHYRLWCDLPYRIPNTAHQRRLVVFQRIDEPIWARQQRAMERHTVRRIESAQNELFKDLKKLLASRGIKKQQRALVSGKKQVLETLHDFPERCEAWISLSEDAPPPGDAPEQLLWYQLAPPLFEMLDVLGTHAPLLVIGIPEIAEWDEAAGFPRGCTLLLPFQDPENVGAVIRSAVAFGVTQVVLLAESAHPYHPRAWRASGGTVLRVRLLEGPALADLPPDLPVVALSAQGQDVGQFDFPDSFALLPGIEGPGLPEAFRARTVGIPMREGVESLNAATATAIALYVWSRRQSAGSAEKTDP